MLSEVKQSIVLLWQQLRIFTNQGSLTDVEMHNANYTNLCLEIFHKKFSQEKKSIKISFNRCEPNTQIMK